MAGIESISYVTRLTFYRSFWLANVVNERFPLDCEDQQNVYVLAPSSVPEQGNRCLISFADITAIVDAEADASAISAVAAAMIEPMHVDSVLSIRGALLAGAGRKKCERPNILRSHCVFTATFTAPNKFGC
uniref:Uncharacterized protein n=1 Tax=Parascaris univalens TaxID=6257 RepID=A0A915CAG6_PARUN